jgi:hypothetical protein
VVTAFFALGPEAFFTAAVEGYFAFGHGFLQGFLVHKAQHEDFMGFEVLDDGWRQAVLVFVEFDLHFFVL